MTTSYVHLFPPHGKVTEAADEYIIELDVPEFTEDELDVCVDGDLVTVVADQELSRGETLQLSEKIEESFRVPDDACIADMEAAFRDGTLELHIPRHRFAVNPEVTPC
jgi:HSP20 family molecular chaperone IbpA